MRANEAVLTCRDCGGVFAFTEDQRHDFAAVGHFHTPSRCAVCRAARKTRQVEIGRRVVAPGFREFRETRTTVTCSACGESTVVPFAARPGRSVYCAACYDRRRLERDA